MITIAFVSYLPPKGKLPGRVFVKALREEKDAIKSAGRGTARWAKTTHSWSLPADPIVVKNLYENMDDITISEDAVIWLNELKDRQDRLYQASQMTEPLDENDRLYKFQRSAARVLNEAGSLILGDEMSLGKTPTTCAAIDHIGAERIIIVCPSQVKWQWVHHLKDWANRYSHVVESQKVVSKDAWVIYRDRADEIKEVLERDSFALIMGYEMMRIHLPELLTKEYDVIVFDEAHRLKNRKAQVTEAAMQLAKQCVRTWLLTGTPVRNGYEDLFTLLHMVDPKRFNSFWNYVNLYLETVPNHFGGTDIIGIRNKEEFNSMVSVYMLRRLKSEVLTELPDKIYQDIKIPMYPEQKKAYDEMEEHLILSMEDVKEGQSFEKILTAPNTVAKLMRLRQICLHPRILDFNIGSAKLDMLQDLITELHNEDKRMVLFSYFRSFLPYIEEILNHLGVRYGTIVGGQDSQERYRIQEALTNGDLEMVIGTAQSMGEGMNLQAASVAIFCDIDWVPANNLQAEDRIHRSGIKTSPQIIRVSHPDTVEEDIMATCIRKEVIIDNAIGSAETIRNMILRKKGG